MKKSRSRPRSAPVSGTAAAPFARLTQLIPRVSDGQWHKLGDLAREFGVDVATIRADLQAVTGHYDARGGFGEGYEVYFEGDAVQVVTSHLRRPLRLSDAEVTALRLGLGVLRLERPPDEHPAIDRALQRLARLRPEHKDGSERQRARKAVEAEAVVYGGPALGAEHANHLQMVRRAIRKRVKVRLAYRKANDGRAERRVVSPYMALRSRGRYFILAWCEKAQALRLFRLDRVEGVELLAESRREVAVSLEGMERAFLGDGAVQLRVRYSARVARWIEEREVVERQGDGSVVATYPLGDVEWAVRHVLQYGGEAEVVEPEEVRAEIRAALASSSARLAV